MREAGDHARFEPQICVGKCWRHITWRRKVGDERQQRIAVPVGVEAWYNQNAKMKTRAVVALREREQAESWAFWYHAI